MSNNPDNRPDCPDCGGYLRYKNTRKIETRYGITTRRIYTCTVCRARVEWHHDLSGETEILTSISFLFDPDEEQS